MCPKGAWANLGGNFVPFCMGFFYLEMEKTMKYVFDWEKYIEKSRQMVAEGCVLLKNDNKVLPLCDDTKVAVFGRIQYDYIKSGTGSGGLVNAPYVVSILDALKNESGITVNEELLSIYEEWLKDNPYDKGKGWAMEPWCQKEMPLTQDIVQKAAMESECAIVVIGRTAGEDKDNSAKEGSYYLSSEEELMLDAVTTFFDRVIVLLNVGNIIDMKWVDKYNPSAVLYCWQGGCEGGNGIVDILMGRVNPSGKLADTIAYNIEDYPSYPYFGDENRNYYKEDIYVGYRYFESCAKEKVMYPFGFGLSYTSFSTESSMNIVDDMTIRIDSRVTNTGSRAGKEVIQVYLEAPEGKLCKPSRSLVGFVKTDTLFPGTDMTVSVAVTMDKLASFDDSGVTGYKDSYVLETGEYILYVGTDVRNAQMVGSFYIGETFATETLNECLTPVLPYERMVVKNDGSGSKKIEWEQVPLRSFDIEERIAANRPKDRECTGDMGYKFVNVMKGEVSIEDYVNQLTNEELINMTRGEGMCSPKVTPGVASAFGGVTETLNKKYGMPIAACSDGPSGIRMDCGKAAFSMPNGTAQACSFNTVLIEELYEFAGQELRYNKIDTLLGPGINVHRNPLNGRNFEYYSEDPLLTGSCAAAELRGLHKYGVTGTCKHFATNNQEWRRHFVDAVVSERALREIYLKPFEMAVKEGGAYSIMTTYGPLNGVYTGGNYDLTTSILRNEWGFDGVVMTDWWAKISEKATGGKADIKNTSTMIEAQNDLYMVTADSQTNANEDNAIDAIEKGLLSRGELLRCAENICGVLKRSPAGYRLIEEDEIEVINPPKGAEKKQNFIPFKKIEELHSELDTDVLCTDGGVENIYTVQFGESGIYEMTIRLKSDAGELSQTTMMVTLNSTFEHAFTINGTGGEWIEKTIELDSTYQKDMYINFYFAQTGLDIDSIKINFIRALSMSDKRSED